MPRVLFRSLFVAIAISTPTVSAQDAATPAVVTKFTSDFGYVATSGNAELTTMSLGEKLTQDRGRLTLAQNFAFVYGEQEGAIIANNLRTGLRGDYKLDELFALFVSGGFERNPLGGIARRFDEQLGVQLRALAAPRDTVKIDAGATATQETSVGGATASFPSARGAAIWKHAFTAAAYFQQNIEAISNLDDTDDWRVNTESALIAPVSRRVGLKMSYVVRYDNVPQAGFSTTDRLFTTGLQLTF